MTRNVYMTDYGPVEITDAEAGLLKAEDWVKQRPNTSDNLSVFIRHAVRLRDRLTTEAKRIWLESRMQPSYFWLGADAEADLENNQDDSR